MTSNKILLILSFIIPTFLFSNFVVAQEKKVAQTSKELFNEIATMDSILFEAFNTQNMEIFKALFTEDLEWYQDNGGLIYYKIVFENFVVQ